MTYDEFKALWQRVLSESGLRPFGAHDGEETLDLYSMDRRYECLVEPASGQESEPFFVTAKFARRWSAVQAGYWDLSAS